MRPELLPSKYLQTKNYKLFQSIHPVQSADHHLVYITNAQKKCFCKKGQNRFICFPYFFKEMNQHDVIYCQKGVKNICHNFILFLLRICLAFPLSSVNAVFADGKDCWHFTTVTKSVISCSILINNIKSWQFTVVNSSRQINNNKKLKK